MVSDCGVTDPITRSECLSSGVHSGEDDEQRYAIEMQTRSGSAELGRKSLESTYDIQEEIKESKRFQQAHEERERYKRRTAMTPRIFLETQV